MIGGSARNFIAADETHHRTLTEGAGKAWAWQVVVEMKAQMDRMRVLSSMHFPVVRLMAQHLGNVDAMAANDAATAEQQLRAHLQGILQDLPTSSRNEPNIIRVPGHRCLDAGRMAKTMNKMNTLFAPCALNLMGGAVMAQEVTLKLGHLANEDNIWHRGVVRFAKEVDTLTEGRVAVEIYPNAPLGKEFTPKKRQAAWHCRHDHQR